MSDMGRRSRHAESPLARREFLSALGRAAAGSIALSTLPPWTRAALAAVGPVPELIERNEWPEHWETSLTALGRSCITSNERFFVRSHFPVPKLDPTAWRLEVKGLVQTPLTLTLAALREPPVRETTATLECAGNGRGLYALPSTSGTQWEYGAVGNARWGGVRLSDVLERAGVKPEAKHVWFEAADRATLPSVPPFLRSIPIEKAMKDVFLAHSMNQVPLPRLHGAPLRAVVPGWFGMASTKWVTAIRLEAAPSDNHFMVKGYRYNYPDVDPTQTEPVEDLRVKSVITRPLEGATLPVGRVRIQGFAWAGHAGLRRVEISTDAGATWRPAGFMGDTEPGAWRTWATEIEVLSPATITVLARATDAAGEPQPPQARPNGSGYANNSIQQVTFRVAA